MAIDSVELTYDFAKMLMNSKDFSEFDESAMQFQEIMMMYNCAIREVRTKLEVLNDEFQVNRRRNPIDTIKSRVKKPVSIFEKAKRKGFDMSISSIMKNMDDIAGIRVICPFIEDIYVVAEMLTNQDDLKILSIDDYIQHPKENGYRSLHIVVEIPIFLSNRKVPMKVEIQLRTIAMDFWAALEHQIHYKKTNGMWQDESIVQELKDCAETIYATDKRMEAIRLKIEELNNTERRIL